LIELVANEIDTRSKHVDGIKSREHILNQLFPLGCLHLQWPPPRE